MKMRSVLGVSGDAFCASQRRVKVKRKRAEMKGNEGERAENPPLECMEQTHGAGGKAATS